MAGADQRKPQAEVDPAHLLDLLERFEKRLDLHDEMLARLLGGYTQLWSGLEALIEFTLDDRPPEDRERWEAGLKWYSQELWKGVHGTATTEMDGGATPST